MQLSARSSSSAIFSGPCSIQSTMLMTTKIADDAQPRLARGVRFQIDDTTGQGVLLYPEGIVELNETAQEIVARCDGRKLSEIVGELAREYDVNLVELAADVRETLADLRRRKLVEFA